MRRMKRFSWMFVAMVGCAVLGCPDDEAETPDATGATEDVVVAGDASPPDVSAPDDLGTTDGAPDDVVIPAEEGGAEEVSEPDVVEPPADAEEVEDVEEDTAQPEDVGEPPSGIGELCFSEIYDEESGGPDYDQFEFTPAKHCWGTDHQDITGVQKVVFLGDSVTVGTPNPEHLLNVDNQHFWRNKTAEFLAEHFTLDRGELIVEWGFWKAYDYFTGKGSNMASGDFKNCSKWGARTDDLMSQLTECMPGSPDVGSEFKTLFLFTMGGNDLAKIQTVGQDAMPDEVDSGYPAAWAVAQSTVTDLEEAIKFMKDPTKFPAGSYVIMANPYEFTDGTGDTSTCKPQSKINIPGIGEFDLSGLDLSVAELAGFKPWTHPEVLEEIVLFVLEEYMRISADHDVDMLWLLEHFCGHGFVATGADADPENRCYRGPDTPIWFDDTCTHPNEAGHAAIAEMFKAVILE